MKKLLLISVFLLSTLALHSTLSIKVKAVSFQYPEYNVDIKVNKDSSFTVKEKAVYLVYGDFHGLRRDLTLSDPNRDELCTTRSNIYCGGFDRVVVNSVKDLKGNDITNKVDLFNNTDEDSGVKSLRFEWEIFPDGEYQSGDQFGWILDYTIYGGIINANNIPYFYWNMLPENRNGMVDSSNISITLPGQTQVRESDIQVFSSLKYSLNVNQNVINIGIKNLPSVSPFTLAYKFNNDEIDLPGQISYSLSPAFGSKIFLDNVDITDQVDGLIKAVPSGNRTVRFEHVGYKTLEQTINVIAGETHIVEANLEPETWMQIFLLLNNVICICGCALIPISLFGVYYIFRKRGKDVDMPKTIIPLFKPPVDTAPYMVGSVVDEQVDKQDIVGSIIDLAYRGYIKIKEVTKDKNYQLTKLPGKEGDKGLNALEQDILNALFKKGDEVETKDLGKTFPMDYIKIQNNIYKEMVNLDYFKRSPVSTIGSYVALGIFLVGIGLVATFAITAFLLSFLGILTIFTPGVVAIVAGIAFIIVAKFMPAKTAKGSKLLADILGFKMYMNTAERLTVQKLEPEDFVKYLGYAIVFGIEKQWAKKFEGIYNGMPDWYEGTSSIYDVYWISSFARNFSNSTVQSMTPVTTSSSSGSGWSGSGSFGGFSGGGGGGGSSGGW